MSELVGMEDGSDADDSCDPFLPKELSDDDGVISGKPKQRRQAGEKVAPKERSGLMKTKLPTILKKVVTLPFFLWMCSVFTSSPDPSL
jgi:hypothetical protein